MMMMVVVTVMMMMMMMMVIVMMMMMVKKAHEGELSSEVDGPHSRTTSQHHNNNNNGLMLIIITYQNQWKLTWLTTWFCLLGLSWRPHFCSQKQFHSDPKKLEAVNKLITYENFLAVIECLVTIFRRTCLYLTLLKRPIENLGRQAVQWFGCMISLIKLPTNDITEALPSCISVFHLPLMSCVLILLSADDI